MATFQIPTCPFCSCFVVEGTHGPRDLLSQCVSFSSINVGRFPAVCMVSSSCFPLFFIPNSSELHGSVTQAWLGRLSAGSNPQIVLSFKRDTVRLRGAAQAGKKHAFKCFTAQQP
eukprot:1158199-Pelagomonas_calceolata.AAC.15